MLELPESVHKVVDLDIPCTSVFEVLKSNHPEVCWLTSRAILHKKISRLIAINA